MRKVDAVMHGAKALSNETRVVPAEWYRFVDCGTGGIVGSDIQAEDTFEESSPRRAAPISIFALETRWTTRLRRRRRRPASGGGRALSTENAIHAESDHETLWSGACGGRVRVGLLLPGGTLAQEPAPPRHSARASGRAARGRRARG